MLVDWWPAAQSIRTQRKINGFEDRRLAGVIITDQYGMVGQYQFGQADAAEILDRNGLYLHPSTPELGASFPSADRESIGDSG